MVKATNNTVNQTGRTNMQGRRTRTSHKLLAVLLSLVMLLGLCPTGLLAAETEEKTPVGKVRVLVENNTALPAEGGGYGEWETDAVQWSGRRVDKEVNLYEDSTAMTCIQEALEGHTVTGADTGYISEVDGLKAGSTSLSGWMISVNDWFPNVGLSEITYAAETLGDGDVICLTYSLTLGKDVGSDYSSSDKKLSGLTVEGAELNPAFSAGRTDYELVVGQVDSATIALTPAAVNKNFLTGIFKKDVTLEEAKALTQDSWHSDSALVGRGKEVHVVPGDILTVVVGAPNWPSMSNGSYGSNAEKVDPVIYRLQVVQTASDTSSDLDAFFQGLEGIATVVNDTETSGSGATYPMTVDQTENALVSSNAGKGGSYSGITLTFQQAAQLSFAYKASSESRYDYLEISRIAADETKTVLNSSSKADFSGDMTEYVTYSLEVNAGESIRLAYYKDYSGDKNSDCIWLKDFAAALPHQVTLHANDGTDTKTQQGIFGTGNLMACPFTREGYRFEGWATTPEGQVAYADSSSITLSDGDLDLYAVWTPVWKVTFPNMPTGAILTVKQGDTLQEASETNTWILADGTYTYSAELFGYETKTDVSFQVEGGDLAISDTLTAAARMEVTFQTTGIAEGTKVAITVYNSENSQMDPKAEDAFVYQLPAGTYTYLVKASGYKTLKGTVTVGDEAQTLQLELATLTAWDGSVATGFAGGDGSQAAPYEIETGEELSYLSQQIAAGDANLTANTYYVLTADIDLNHQAFIPIGKDSSHTFSGHFEGNGYTISNLKVEREDSYAGLFGRTNASITNLTIDSASVTSTSGYVGVLAGAIYSSSNTISGCAVKNSSVTGGSNYTGGLAGYCAIAINQCAVQDTRVSGTGYVGGLFGQNSQNITECYALRIQITASGNYVGGLNGSTGYSAGQITSCFARGSLLTSGGYAGGLLGNCDGYYTKAGIQKSYAVMDVTAQGGNAGALVGTSNASITEDSSFYSTDSTVTASGTLLTGGTGKSLAELKNREILSSLGTEFQIYAEEDGIVNAGFPYLKNAPAIAKILPQTLASPAVSWTGKTVSWTEVDHALGYKVELAKDSAAIFSESITGLTKDFATLMDLSGSGTYLVRVTALGDGENYGNSPSVTAETTITVISGEVTFRVTTNDGQDFPSDRLPEIRLTMADGSTELTLKNGVARSLPLGTYTYLVSAKTYGSQTGSFTLTEEGFSQDITLVYSAAWDGETTLEPQQVDGVYQISNGYELAWFRDQVNAQLAGSTTSTCGLNAILTQDISLGNQDWIAIGKVTATSPKGGYIGTFDGQGYTISGLKPLGNEVTSYGSTSVNGAGLFGCVYTGGAIRNLTVEGKLEAVKYSGGIAAILAGGSVENCINRMSVSLLEGVSDGYSIGGIVGYMTNYSAASSLVTGCRNEGTIDIGSAGRYVGGIVGNGSYGIGVVNCANLGTVTSGTNGGGIVGNATIPVTACYNRGSVTATGDSVGGIAGFANKEIKDCYNTASIEGAGTSNGVGGLVGQLHSEYGGKITGGFNSGIVTASGSLAGALAGSKGGSSAVITRTYYLVGSCGKAIGSNAAEADQTEPVSQEKLASKGIIGLLGGSFASLEGTDYPVLKWQDANAKTVLTFILPEEATVTLEGAAALEGEPGVYILEDGSYSYQVSKEGYVTKEDQVTIHGESTSLSVELEQVTYDVTFTISPAGAAISVTNEAGDSFQAGEEGVFALPVGTYTYDISKFGYLSAQGTFTVVDQNLEIPAITLVGADTYPVTLTFTDEDNQAVTPGTVTLKAADGTTVSPDSAEAFVYSLPDGTYTYSVADSRYYGVEGSFTVAGQALTIPLSLEINRTWDGSSKTEVTPNPEGIYEIGNAAELAWFAAQVNAGNLTYNAKLTADIYVNYKGSTNTWTSIGSYSNQYAGTFDGNGKTIYGLDTALFAYNGSESLVKDLTVYGSNSGYSNVGGICNASYGAFDHCINYMTIEATGPRVGGIVGVLYSPGSISNCANYGSISTSYSGSTSSSYTCPHLGGIAGKSSGNISGCFNAGSVTASGASYGGTGGITGEIAGAQVANCYNSGPVTGPSRTGGIVGLANTTGSSVENCYNVGTITTESSFTNPFCGAIAGSIGDSNGAQVGSVNNCYYLENSYSSTYGGTTWNGGVGYAGSGVADPTESKTAGEMKLGSFALALSPTDHSYNMDSDAINNGYPVLTWQGGSEPVISQDEQDLAADKASLTLASTRIDAPTQLELPSMGEHGSAISWTSSNTDLIALDGTVTLPLANDAQVTLTATLTKGDVTDTKTFLVTVLTQSSADAAVLETIKAALGTRLRVPYYEDGIHVTEAMEERIDTVLYNKGITSMSSADITVTLANAGTVTYGSGDLIAEDGSVTYYYENPSQGINGDAIVQGVTFRLSTESGAAVTTNACMVLIPWDQAKVKAEMQKAADLLTFDAIKGSNTDADQVSTDLTLPQILENYGWATISWQSSNSGVINITGGEVLTDYTGSVIQPQEDQQITLTATLTFNKNDKDEDGPITLTKELVVTVPGTSEAYMTEIQEALDKFTLDQLTYATGANKGSVIDPEAVTDNIQLLTSSKLGIDGGKNGYKIQYSIVEEDQNAVSINGYRANVVRPIAEAGTQVTLRLTLTKQKAGVLNPDYSAYKDLTLGIAPLKPSEIQAELTMLEKVKANFFEGINDGKNVSKNAITENLHAFREAYLNDQGEVVWVYNAADMTDAGIVPADLEGYDSMSSAGWRIFRSSNTAVISHENMLVTCPQTEDAEVTIEANLKSSRFGDFYTVYAEDETYGPIFKRLAGEPVSVTVKVISKENQEKAEAVRYSAAIGQGSSLALGEDARLSIAISNQVETTYNAYQLVLHYDADKLTYKSINTDAYVKDENGVLTILGYGDEKSCETDQLILTFSGKAVGSAEVSLISANIDKSANVGDQDTPFATIVTPAVATMTVTGYRVDLSDDFTGSATADPGEDYTFTAKDSHYDYSITATMGGEPVEALDNGNGSFTIKNVTGNLVITDTKAAKQYEVRVSGNAAEDLTAGESATYLTDYSFLLNQNDSYTYELKVTVGGQEYVPTLAEDGKTYTIPGASVTGPIVLQATKEEKPVLTTQITFTGTGSGDVVGGNTQTAANGSDFNFEIQAEEGYNYQVSLEEEVLQAGEDGKYTIPGSKISGQTITVQVEKTPKSDLEVEASQYIKLNGTSIWLITATATVSQGKILGYEGSAMFWSEKYQAYSYLIISGQSQDEVKAAAKEKIAEVAAEKVSVAYNCDVNQTGQVDINDAQLTYNMYNAAYDNFEKASMRKFLEADVNGDKQVNVTDAAAIVSHIVGA